LREALRRKIMLTPEEFIEVMKEIRLWSYDTELTVNESEGTYCPSNTVCTLENIEYILATYTSPF
jgi:hypothetical protein